MDYPIQIIMNLNFHRHIKVTRLKQNMDYETRVLLPIAASHPPPRNPHTHTHATKEKGQNIKS